MSVIAIGIGIYTGSRKRGGVAGSIPVNVSIPEITGIARVGVQLLCSQGTWDGSPSPTFAYQWKAAGVNVGANLNTYTPVTGDVAKVMTCQVTATNASGSANATSLGTLPVLAATVTVAQQLISTEPNGLSIGFVDNSLIIRDVVTPANNYEGTASGKVAFTRATAGYRYNSAGLLALEAINQPRLNFNPVTREALGLLIESAATNLCLQSQTFNNGTWTKSSISVTADAIAAPDGTLTADKMVPAAASAEHKVYQNVASLSGAVTWSMYAKAGEWNWLFMDAVLDGTIHLYAYFNLAMGAIGQVAAGLTASIQSVGNGWYLCAVTGTAATDVWMQPGITTSDGTPTSIGDGASGLYFWGSQLETGTAPSSYFPTTAAAATRALDECKLLVTAIPYSQTQGMMVTQPSPVLPDVAALRMEACINDDGGANQIWNAINYTFLNLLVEDIGGAQSNLSPTGSVQSMIGQTWQANDFAATANGDVPLTDNAGAIPGALTNINFGNRYAAGPFALQGSLAKFLYLPRRVTNAELQAKTTPF